MNKTYKAGDAFDGYPTGVLQPHFVYHVELTGVGVICPCTCGTLYKFVEFPKEPSRMVKGKGKQE